MIFTKKPSGKYVMNMMCERYKITGLKLMKEGETFYYKRIE
tara:strand:+ start:550 stop:672 length:123 start_codon:yes stop_codon:yes gene_type:complete